jgi:hypothetical protein
MTRKGIRGEEVSRWEVSRNVRGNAVGEDNIVACVPDGLKSQSPGRRVK